MSVLFVTKSVLFVRISHKCLYSLLLFVRISLKSLYCLLGYLTNVCTAC